MSKTLSNGLMGLRFMQNAQRAKEQAQVELEQAKVKDEAEWEVSQEIKDAWGISSSSSESTSSVVHESSYLPFLFTSSAAGTPDSEARSKPKGRRSFNTKGKEVKTEKVKLETTPAEDAPESQPSKRLTSISGFRAPLPTKADPKSSKGVKGKSVQELIREDVTRRAPTALTTATSTTYSSLSQDSKASSLYFLKPAGVDSPSTSAPAQVKGVPAKKKRDRDESGDAGGKKRKKERGSGVHMIE